MTSPLAQLEAAISENFQMLMYPPKGFVPNRQGPDGKPLCDVLIIGAGMNGLAAAFALRRLGITNIRHIDAGRQGFAGPWLNYARMEYLRSGKNLTGPAQGHALLTPRAWWQASRPEQSWDELDYFTRQDWAAYLNWYGRMTAADITWQTELTAITAEDDFVIATLAGMNGKEEFVHCRQLVLANGREGLARPRIPAAFQRFADDPRIQHSSQSLAKEQVSGRHVAVIGLAASAFDNAATAAEAGARVTLVGRAKTLPRLNKMKHTVTAGFAEGFPLLADSDKLAWLRHITACRIAPPRHTVQRVAKLDIELVCGAEISEVAEQGEALLLTAGGKSIRADLVILGTGFTMDLAAMPALADLASSVTSWQDRLPSSAWQTGDDEWRRFPYLGKGFEFFAQHPQRQRALGRIRCFNHAAQLSLGNLANDIPHASFGAERLARALAADFFVEDNTHHYQALVDYNEPELLGDEWPAAFRT
jgi:cation diffusion facilitator CzcD-associated flavoprotein CzcO